MPILVAGEAVHHFIQRPIASARDDEMAAIFMGLLCDFCCIACFFGFRQVRVNSTLGENAASFIEHAAAAIAAIAGVRVVNQKCVLYFGVHP